ncbi:MAG: two-component system, OmpR family, sensor kinase [Frankiaceae bacterium]|jgi:two-component system OmpR family sensor kinase|nr:two-component system, OmpR family, sensor kinase [Frankiaceae bacterium]
MNPTPLMRRLPLRVKLVAASVLLVVVGLAASGVAAAATLRGYLMQRVDDQLAQASGQYLGPGYGAPPQGDPDHGAGFDRGGPSQFYAAFLGPTGTVESVRPPDLGTYKSPPRLPPLTSAQVAALHEGLFTVRATADDTKWRVIARPLRTGGGSVLVAVPLSDVQHTVGRLELLELLIGGIVVIVLAGAGYVVVRRSLRPLAEIELTAAAIAAGDLTQRVPEHDQRTEVGRLANALNGMLGQIERAFHVQQASEGAARKSEQQMRRFVADASHELRTPLTSIRGFAELFRQGAVGTEEDLQRVMRRIEDEAARMGVLVDDLLLLARLDQHRPLERQQVGLTVLAADAVQDASAVAPDREVVLDAAEVGDRLVVTGDELRLRQVLGNLVGNALSHTPAGSRITVRVSRRSDDSGRWAVLEVADEGPGLTAEQAERVFERFYRADPSRTRSEGGTGLGLSIVAGLTEAHGGRVELDTDAGVGATFRVLLPLADATTPASV